jgi:DNA-binding response OmpR family regulator
LEILQPGDVLILHRSLAAPKVRPDDDQLRDAPLATAGASGVIPRSSSTTTVLPKRPRRICSDLEVDPDGRRVFVGGELVDVTRIEFDILDILSANPGVVVSRDQLFAEVWGDNHCDDHGLEIHISNLRKKLDKAGQASRRIQTFRGVGYRLERS